MFTGATAAPTMLSGMFVSTGGSTFDYLLVNGAQYGSLAGTTVYVTPEPGTMALLAAGLALTVWLRRRRAASVRAPSLSLVRER